MKYLITGACGFIGSHFVDYIKDLNDTEDIAAIDRMGYASNIKNLDIEHEKVSFQKLNINSKNQIKGLLKAWEIDQIVNFAASTHVDNSIKSANAFIKDNICGVQVLLDCIQDTNIKMLQISTDEVFGSVLYPEISQTKDKLDPSSAYSASKASAELLCRAAYKTHHTDVAVVRCVNNYGPRQHEEKFIPYCISQIIKGKPIGVYGDGMNLRCWIYVEDCCREIYRVLQESVGGELYHIGSYDEISNLQVVDAIECECFKSGFEDLPGIKFVEDRKGHDRRYCISSSLNQGHKISFENGIRKTVKYYIDKNKEITI